MTSRTRAVVLLGFSAACAGIAVSLVNGYTRDVRAQVGPLVPVAVARTDIRQGKLISASNAPRLFSSRLVPRRFVPADALGPPGDAIGYRTAIRLPAGAYLTEGGLVPPSGDVPPHERRGGITAARAVEVAVAGATSLGDALRPGAVVDVLVTSEHGGGSPRTYLALQRLDVLAVHPGGSGGAGSPEGGEADAVAVLKVDVSQALLLTAAQNFAREVRLVPRDPGDRRRLSLPAVSAADLHP
jgi:pilus assembly protein CpaB